PSLPAGLQPFAPKLWSAVRICASVIVKFAHESGSVCCIRRLPVFCVSWLKHVIPFLQNFLPTHNILQRHTSCVPQHVVKHHECRCSSKPRFAVEMRPGILRKLTDSNNKAIHFLIEWTRMVRDRDEYVMRASTFDNIPLRACAFDSHALRCDRIAVAVFDRVPRSNINFAAGLKRLNPRGFVPLNIFLTPSDIRPVV